MVLFLYLIAFKIWVGALVFSKGNQWSVIINSELNIFDIAIIGHIIIISKKGLYRIEKVTLRYRNAKGIIHTHVQK